MCMVCLNKCFAGKIARPDLTAAVSAGLFHMALEVFEAFATNGVAGVANTHRTMIICMLAILRNCCGLRDCAAAIKGISHALIFCLEHPVHVSEAFAFNTGGYAAVICTFRAIIPS